MQSVPMRCTPQSDCFLFSEVSNDGQHNSITLPNPWREKAKGKIIRHVPITLYADDTSGNQSKRWNKHISYYFTLSGIPPVLANMEYNIHFISTSNVAGPLELAESIVNQLKYVFSFELFDLMIDLTME